MFGECFLCMLGSLHSFRKVICGKGLQFKLDPHKCRWVNCYSHCHFASQCLLNLLKRAIADAWQIWGHTRLIHILWIFKQWTCLFGSQFTIFWFFCVDCMCFNNRLNFAWVLICYWSDMLSLFIVQHLVWIWNLCKCIRNFQIGLGICENLSFVQVFKIYWRVADKYALCSKTAFSKKKLISLYLLTWFW